MKITKTAILFFIFSCLVLCHDFNQFKTRVSIFNFGLDYTKYSNVEEIHRSIYLAPLMFEKENFEFGLYLTPFVLEEYDDYGNYVYDNMLDSYLVNLRLRFIGDTLNDKIKVFSDLAYSDGNALKWKDIRVSWLEVGVFSRINYTTKIFMGYKKTLNTNVDVDIDGFFVNLAFGHSFLRRK